MRFLGNGFVIAALVTVSSTPAWADENGLPQFDTSLFPEQLFWLAVTFALLYLLMSRVALPRVATTQANRGQVIASEIAAARAASDQAKTATAVAEKSLNNARANAQASVSEMMAKVAQEQSSSQTSQERELQRRLHSAEEAIAVSRQAALHAIGGSVGELSASIIEKIIHSKGRAA